MFHPIRVDQFEATEMNDENWWRSVDRKREVMIGNGIALNIIHWNHSLKLNQINIHVHIEFAPFLPVRILFALLSEDIRIIECSADWSYQYPSLNDVWRYYRTWSDDNAHSKMWDPNQLQFFVFSKDNRVDDHLEESHSQYSLSANDKVHNCNHWYPTHVRQIHNVD